VTDIASLFVWRRSGVVIVAIAGEVDISNARELHDQIAAELAGDDALVVDLGGLSFLDAAGVHLLYALADRVRRFAIVLPEDSFSQRVLDLSGPRPRRWSYRTEDEAIAAVLG
jgi:stage II sporulation protein AA (anti-sigma F factor antagonist)